jgi:hypothetical protein
MHIYEMFLKLERRLAKVEALLNMEVDKQDFIDRRLNAATRNPQPPDPKPEPGPEPKKPPEGPPPAPPADPNEEGS